MTPTMSRYELSSTGLDTVATVDTLVVRCIDMLHPLEEVEPDEVVEAEWVDFVKEMVKSTVTNIPAGLKKLTTKPIFSRCQSRSRAIYSRSPSLRDQSACIAPPRHLPLQSTYTPSLGKHIS